MPPIMSPTMSSTTLTPTSSSEVQLANSNNQPHSQRDTTWTKLFVGGLPYHTTDKSLREHFDVYGEIEEAVVITDRSTAKSRGYGFVIMSEKEGAERACKEPNPIIDGRKANVNLAILGAKPRANITATQLPLTSLRPGFPALMQGQYGQPVAQPGSHPYLQQLYAAAAQQQAFGLNPNMMQLAGMATGNPLLDMYSQYAAQAQAQAYSQQMVPVSQSTLQSSPTLASSTEQQQLQQQGLLQGQSQSYAQALQYAYNPSMLTPQHLTAAGLSMAGMPAYAPASGPSVVPQPLEQ